MTHHAIRGDHHLERQRQQRPVEGVGPQQRDRRGPATVGFLVRHQRCQHPVVELDALHILQTCVYDAAEWRMPMERAMSSHSNATMHRMQCLADRHRLHPAASSLRISRRVVQEQACEHQRHHAGQRVCIANPSTAQVTISAYIHAALCGGFGADLGRVEGLDLGYRLQRQDVSG